MRLKTETRVALQDELEKWLRYTPPECTRLDSIVQLLLLDTLDQLYGRMAHMAALLSQINAKLEAGAATLSEAINALEEFLPTAPAVADQEEAQ